jgi:hypothetical protein
MNLRPPQVSRFSLDCGNKLIGRTSVNVHRISEYGPAASNRALSLGRDDAGHRGWAGALFVAVLCTLLLVAFTGPKYDLVIVNDRVIGGTEGRLTVFAVGSVFGAVAVFCALRIRIGLIK